MDTTNAVLNWAVDAAGPFAVDATLYRTVTDVHQQLLDGIGLFPVGPERAYTTTTDGIRATADTGFALGWTDHAVTFVLDAFRDEVTTDDATAIGGSLTPSGQRSIGSFLVQDAIALTPSTVAIAELRYDSYRLESDDGDVSGSELSPGLTLRQQVGGALTLHATVAQAYRPPTLSESLVNGMHPEPADFFVRPNPNLKPERSLTTEAGATLALADLIRPGDRLDAVLTAYRNDVEDFIGLVERGTLFDRYLQYDNIRLGPHRGHRARDRLRRRAPVRQPLRPDHRRGKPRDRRPGLGHRAEPAGADRRLAHPRPDPRGGRPADGRRLARGRRPLQRRLAHPSSPGRSARASCELSIGCPFGPDRGS